MLEFISSTFPGQLYPMYAEKIAKNQFHLSSDVPGARVEGEYGTCRISHLCCPQYLLHFGHVLA